MLELPAGVNLPAGKLTLFRGEVAGLGLALHRTGKAGVGAVTGVGVGGAGAAGLGALHVTLADRAVAHGLGLGEALGQLSGGRNGNRGGGGHAQSYGVYCRKSRADLLASEDR